MLFPALLFLILGLLNSKILTPVNKLWLKFGELLGKIIAPIVMGIVYFVYLMAILSISLGVLNLLPIPVLDGGHLVYYSIEMITGRPVSEKIQLIAQQFGLIILFGIMILAFYNDYMRLIG